MRRWAVITVALYVLLFVAVATPAVIVFDSGVGILVGEAPRDASSILSDYLGFLAEPYNFWPYLAAVAIAAAAQALMLVVPVKAVQDIKLKKRHILTPIVTAAFLMGVLVAAGLVSAAFAVLGDGPDEHVIWTCLSSGIGAWILWIVLFRQYVRSGEEPKAWLARITDTLYRGSILELLVAVASHIVVRRRGDCSAPIGTLIGMAAGIAVMFISFGPGVFYLFAERRRRMMSRRQRESAEEPTPPAL